MQDKPAICDVKGNNCVNCHVVAAARRAREARLAYSREDWKLKMQGVQYENIETGKV